VEEKEGQFKKFTLITKKGHKQHLKELNIPVESVLASSLEDTQQALKVEKEEMKRIVLNHKRRQEEEDNTQDPATKSSILPVQQDIIKRTQLQHHPAWQQSYHHHGNRPKPHPSQKKPGDWQKK
jgi:regulator of nonsense transcripts 2